MKFYEDFSKTNVLIVGDVMLDRYWWGSVSRISPEAPVPVVNLESTTLVVGGAANVAANVAGLGAKPYLVSLIGEDEESDLLLQELSAKQIRNDFLTKSSHRRTTVKTRLVAHSQQVVRIDQETKKMLISDEATNLWANIEPLLNEVQIIIVSDYGKGIITENFVSRLITTARQNNVNVLVDPKGKYYNKYKNASFLTPNRFEVAEVCQLEDTEQETIENAGRKMLKDLSLDGLLVTQGEAGMTLFEKDKPALHLPVTARNVYDVTGAGDTVIACMAAAIGNGASFCEAANFANKAAGLVVEQVGTTAISLTMLNNAEKHEVQ
jgi:D-beta-D-heptose 7-phosphate kinase/D-beta-D-heptose 1-phosphate adenosyltransferase